MDESEIMDSKMESYDLHPQHNSTDPESPNFDLLQIKTIAGLDLQIESPLLILPCEPDAIRNAGYFEMNLGTLYVKS